MRLIDADALLETMKATDRYFMVKFDIENAPTIDQWHYPSMGEYPPMDEKVYLWRTCDDFPVVAKRHDFKRHDEEWSWDCYWGSGFILKHDDERIIAWQYIIPPEENN